MFSTFKKNINMATSNAAFGTSVTKGFAFFVVLISMLSISTPSFGAVTVSNIQVIDPTDEVSNLLFIDARDPNDGFVPSYGIVRVTFQDDATCDSALISNYYLTTTARAQDETEYVLYDFKRHGESGDYDATKTLGVTCSGGVYTADYQFNPTETQALGFYDFEAYIFDTTEGAGSGVIHSYSNNLDIVELTSTGIGGFPVNAPILDPTGVAISVSPVDIVGAPGTSTNLTINFDDDDFHLANTFDITITVRHPDNKTETVIVSGPDGTTATRAGDSGTVTVNGAAAPTYSIAFNWNPEDDVFYPQGKYDIEIYVKDEDGLSSTSTYSVPANDGKLELTGGAAVTTVPPNTPGLTSNSPVVPGGTETVVITWLDDDKPLPGNLSMALYFRNQDTDYIYGPFVPSIVTGGGGSSFTGTYNWDTTGALDGWYDIYFEVIDDNLEGMILPYEDYLEEFYIGSTVDITSVTVSGFNVDIQPDELDPMLWPIDTTITANFNDSNSGAAGDYTVTIIARHPDNSTETVLVDAKKSGEDGMTVAGSGTGPYTATFTWTPLAGSDEGLYDLFVSINDGAVGNTDESDYVENLDIISLIDDPTLPPPPYELNEAPTVGLVGLTNSCIGGGCSGFETASISFDFYDFEDEGVSSYLVSVSIRGIDGVTIYDLITDGDNTLIGSGLCAYDDANCTLSITSNGDGNYTGTLTWNADNGTFTGLEGYYDVQVVVKDGVGAGGESSYDTNDDVLNISNSTTPPPATDPPIITGLSVVTIFANPDIQLETTQTADFTATFTDGDNPTDTSKYTLVYKVRDTGGTEVSVTCTANVTNLGSNSFSDTCTGWLPSGTINTGFYDLQIAITDNNGTPGDVTDDVTSVYDFDSNIDELNVLAAANAAPNAPSAIDHVDGADVTLGAVTAYTTGSTVKFQATMTDQNALDDVWLEVEVEEIATAYNDTNGSDNFNIFCFPDFPHFYEEPTAVDGEIDCTITADGEYKWQYRVVDGGGLSTAWTSFGNPAFIRDTVAPTADAPTATPISGIYVAGTFDVTATLTDTTAGIGSCELTINNGGFWSTGTVGGSKPTFTCSQTAKTCTNGSSVDIAARVSDLAGNGPTVSSTTTYTCDSAAPTYTWNTPLAGADYKDTSVIPVDVTIADVGGVGLTNGAPCNAKIDGALTGFTGTVTYNAGSCTGNLTIDNPSGFSEGDHGITIQVADKLGTSAVSVTRTVTIDNTPPVTTLAGNSGGNWSINDHSSIVLSPTDGGSGVASTEYCVDTSLNTCVPNSTGDQFGTGTAISVTCGAGSACYQYIRYRSIDNSANAETVKSSISLIDKQLPTDNGANLTITNSAPDCKLDWTAATDGHSGMVGGSAAYKISRTTDPAPAPGVNCTADVIDTISSALITYTDTTTVIPNLYNYRICAVDAVGNVSAGLPGSQQCNTGDTTAPTVASGPTLDATTSDPGGGPDDPYVAGGSGFNYTTVFTEAESSLTSCEYTIDGSTWSAGVVTGPVGNDYTCTASAVTCPTHDALLTINMKGTSSGGSVTATAITTYMCDNVVPDPSDTINTAWVQSTSEAVAITENDLGSGILSGNAWTKYCYNGTDNCTPSTLGTSFNIACAAGSTCRNFVKYESSDRAGNKSGTISSTTDPVRQDNEGPLLTLGTTAHSPTQCQYNFTVADDASGTVGIGMSSSAPSEIKIARSVGGSAPANCNSPYDTIAGNLIIYTDNAVDPESEYSYRFCAYDLLGNTNSAYDAIADTGTTNECSTVSADTTAPTMNTVSVASVSPRSVTLSWTAPSDNGDGTDTTDNPVKFYDVKYLESIALSSVITGLSDAAFWGHANILEAAKEPQPTTPGTLQIAPIACQLGANNWSCPTSGQDTLLRPNSLYYFAVKATDDEDEPNVSGMSNITDGTVDLVGSHTALKYGWNIVSVPHNVNVGSTKLEDLFGDDLVANAYVFTYGWDGSVANDFVDLDETVALNTQIGQGQGFYLYSYWSDKAIDQHLNAGGSLADNATNWVQVTPAYFDDSQNAIELIGNPYNANVDFNDVMVCDNPGGYSDAGGCSGGTIYQFGEAADAGWLSPSIVSYPNSTTPLTETCSGNTTGTCAPVMRPWWGYEVEILSGSAPANIFFAVPKP